MASAVDRVITRYPHQLRSRAVVKTLLYRVFMLVLTMVVVYGFTGNVGDAVNIGIVTNLAKTGTYYVYERAWDRIAWGV